MKCGICIALTMLAGTVVADESGVTCSGEPDAKLRLACYDRAFANAPATLTLPVVPPTAPTGELAAIEPSAMATEWELGTSDKRRDFTIRTYHPNFLLPLHYTNRINRAPSSPTQGPAERHDDYRQAEVKLQISLRAKVVEDLLLPGADLWVAYTQRSLWQLWDSQDSAPFRSTDYQPELIYVVPVPEQIGRLPFGWNWRMVQLGAVHQSNGQSEPLSRSWNRMYLGLGLEKGNLGLMLRVNQRLRVQNNDDNPDLVDYIGRGELAMNWAPGASTVGLTWRSQLNSTKRGSLQLDWTYPVFASQPTGLRWYLQVFSGYGATMLDYNHRQTTVGVGLSLFQF
ncbi:MAG: phospholipase [Betaproteobacteria bacterium HGW-Betaproteobacteria-7]|nr:MAG: phospholipase [Betaproteobacteria bacterium HGW-Betaproteobacteria-7]